MVKNTLSKLRRFAKDYGHHLYWHLIIAPVYYIILSGFSDFKDGGWRKFKEYAIQNPEIFFYAVILALLTTASYQLISPFKKTLIKGFRAQQLLLKIGLRDFSEHSDEQRKKLDWEECRSTIERSNSVNILGAGGYETLGAGAPLAGFLENYTGALRILLFNPESPNFKSRCMDISASEEDYKKWVQDTITACRKAVALGRTIELKLYDDSPIWKMIFTENYLWLQYYAPRTPVENTPVYQFQSMEQKPSTSLYYPFTKVFERRWKLGKSIDLSDSSKKQKAKPYTRNP